MLWDLEKGCLTQTRGGVWKRVQRERLALAVGWSWAARQECQKQRWHRGCTEALQRGRAGEQGARGEDKDQQERHTSGCAWWVSGRSWVSIQ